jgi:hypothetical protein
MKKDKEGPKHTRDEEKASDRSQKRQKVIEILE